MAPVSAFEGKLRVDLLGDFLNDRHSLGDLFILKLGNIPEQKAHIRVHIRTADARILQS